MVRRPTPRSWYAFGALAVGLCAGRWVGGIPSTAWFAVAAFLCAAAVATRGTVCRASLFAAVACLGAGWFTARLLEPAADSLSLRLDGVPSAIVRVEGVVLESPRRAETDPDPMALPIHDTSWKARLKLTAAEGDKGMEPASGRVWVRVMGEHPSPPARAGDRVRVDGVFTPIAPPMNPGEEDRRLWAGQEGYCGSLHTGDIEVVDGGRNALDAAEGAWLRARAWMTDRAHALLLGDDAPSAGGLSGTARSPGSSSDPASLRQREGRALLAALILGEEEPALRETRGAFNRLGLAHVLSISGFHLAVLAMVALFALRAIGDLGWREPALVSLLVLAYLAILPFNAPVWRSGLMVLGLLAADAAGRRYDRLAMLGWIALALILWRPMDLWSLGFQLSFGLVALLIWMGDAFDARLWGRPLRGTVPPPPSWRRSVLRPAAVHTKRLVSTNLMCCLAATPLLMCQTGLVSVLSVVSGVIVVPLITVVLIAGYAAAGIGVLIPGATGATAKALAALAGWTSWLVARLDETPWSSLRAPNVSALWVACATAVVLYWLARGDRRSRGAWAATAAIIVWGGASAWLGSRLPAQTALRIDTLAVGDGTCEIVRSGDQALLWDCGSLEPGVGRMLVPRAARALGAWRIGTALVTHPNIDHFNGLLDVIEPLRIGRVLVGEAFVQHAAEHPHSPEALMLSELRRRGVEVKTVWAGERVSLGDTQIEFLSPARGATWPEDNNMSLVGLITIAGRPAALMCGDIQGDAMAYINRTRPGLLVPILEAPHHGSAREPAYEFVEGLDPAVVLQSTGPSRANDPRWADVRRGRAWWCTAVNGAAWAEFERDGSVRSGALRHGR